MNKTINKVLTDGLQEGYVSGKPHDIKRATFSGQVSHIESPESMYHDEWFVDTRVGGGQELVMKDGQKYTRLYGGGSPDATVLTSLGITLEAVSFYLKSKILELGNRTRLFSSCTAEPDGDWKYSYVVTSNDESIELATGIESIHYKSTPVHLHAFILSPIK